MATLRRRVRALLLQPFLRGLSWLLGRLPWSAVQRFGGGLGRLGWRFGGRERRRTLEHLAIGFPELSAAERVELGREVFANQGRNVAECLALLAFDCEQVGAVARVEGWEIIEELREAGRPIVILTAHCGNWEMLGAALNCRGLGMAVIGRSVDEQRLNQFLLDLRQRFGAETIERSKPGAARRLLKVLREGRALGILIDQDTNVEGDWVPFFGRPAYTPLGAAKIALKQDAAVLPSFAERGDDGRHVIRVHPPLDLPAGTVEATARMTEAIEAQIRRRPAEWVWMHRRWRRQPS